jgi:branched-chain amino acid transport system substrate-binding protein
MRLNRLLLAASVVLPTVPAMADQLKVGLVSTFSGSESGYGEMVRNGFNLGVQHFGGKLGGADVVVTTGDDENKTDVAIQQATKMVDANTVDVVIGPTLTTTLLGVNKVTTQAKVPMISGGPGPSVLAGKQCSPWSFNVSWQNDALAEATGQYLTDKKVPNLYTIAPQIQAGRDMVNGVKYTFKGDIVGEKYTQMTQMDFAAEISEIQAAAPKAVFVFFPGGQLANFIQQWNQAGMKEKIPLYTMNALDQTTLPALGDIALGIVEGTNWVETLDNPVTKDFVAAYEAAYHRLPSVQAAAGYNTALILNAAITSLGGKVPSRDALRQAIQNAKFVQDNGQDFKFGSNNMPVENYYVATVAKGPDGKAVLSDPQVVLKDYTDRFAKDCKMQAP